MGVGVSKSGAVPCCLDLHVDHGKSTVLGLFTAFSRSPKFRNGISPLIFFIRLLLSMILTIIKKAFVVYIKQNLVIIISKRKSCLMVH